MQEGLATEIDTRVDCLAQEVMHRRSRLRANKDLIGKQAAADRIRICVQPNEKAREKIIANGFGKGAGIPRISRIW